MTERPRNDWAAIGAVALIIIGVLALLNQVGGGWWSTIRAAFRYAFSIAWPLAIIGLGLLLLIGARRGMFAGVDVAGKRLYRSRKDKVVSGVLGGLANYLGWDPTWVRLVYAAITIFGGFGPGLIIYIICSIVIPEAPVDAPQEVSWPGSPTWSAPGTETVQSPPPAPPVPPAPPIPDPPAPPSATTPPAPPAPPAG